MIHTTKSMSSSRSTMQMIKQLMSNREYLKAKQLITAEIRNVMMKGEDGERRTSHTSSNMTNGTHIDNDAVVVVEQLYFHRARVNNKMQLKQYVYSDYLRAISIRPNFPSIYLLMMDVFLYQFKSAYWANQVFAEMYKNCSRTQLHTTEHEKQIQALKRAIDEAMEEEESDALMYFPKVINEYDTSVGENSNFFSLLNSNNFEIRDDHNGYRGLFATRDIAKGEIILDEKPFVSIGLNENRCIRCGHILRHNETRSVFCRDRQTGMKTDRFCGETLADFREYFTSTSTELPKLSLLFARLVAQQVEKTDSDQVINLYDFNPFLALLNPSQVFLADQSDESKHVPMDLVPIQNLYNLLVERLQFTDADYAQNDFETFERLVLTFVNYNFSFNKSRDFFIGNILSFVNHSCDSNAEKSVTKDGERTRVWASRDIKKGEEVTIAYFDPETATPETSFMYGFSCGVDCRCKKDS